MEMGSSSFKCLFAFNNNIVNTKVPEMFFNVSFQCLVPRTQVILTTLEEGNGFGLGDVNLY